jgi:hypothetical protein
MWCGQPFPYTPTNLPNRLQKPTTDTVVTPLILQLYSTCLLQPKMWATTSIYIPTHSPNRLQKPTTDSIVTPPILQLYSTCLLQPKMQHCGQTYWVLECMDMMLSQLSLCTPVEAYNLLWCYKVKTLRRY